MNILVTGATGFVGKNLCRFLLDQGHSVHAIVRSIEKQQPFIEGLPRTHHLICIKIENIDANTQWEPHLNNIDIVIHLAARVHVLKEQVSDPLDAFRKTNYWGTKQLVSAAMASGVKRFIYLSSIAVNGQETVTNAQGQMQAFTYHDEPKPTNAYGISKYEAEQAIQAAVTQETSMDFVIIRPPLIYGPGAEANFLKLVKLVKTRLPLPIQTLKNQRSFVYIDNVIDFIARVMVHPKAANHIFLVADPQPVSTTELIRFMARALNIKPLIFAFPISFLRFVLLCCGQGVVARRLFNSLVIDNHYARTLLDWAPPYTTAEGIEKSLTS